MINILNLQDIQERLKLLNPDTTPQFGQMTAQHMVEHLDLVVLISNGSKEAQLLFPVEKAEKMKQVVIYTDQPIPIGFRSPALPSVGLPDLVFSDLELAKNKLVESLDLFFDFFKQNPEAEPMNITLGKLNYKEWLIFHNKHFTHHFKQFSL